MPMSRYEIRNEYSLADPELYRAADKDDPEALLEGVAMAGLVGVLRQLGDLAEFAAEIFNDLHEEVLATAARGNGLTVRVQQLEAEVPSIEKAFLSQTDHSSFFHNAGANWHPKPRLDQNLVTQGDLPRFVMDSYEECRGPPRLFLLDKFDVAGAGSCLKRYTDPSFFKVETSAMTEAAVHREKKNRKAKKRGQRWRNGETPEVVPMSHARLHQLLLEEPVENGISKPTRHMKLKRRPHFSPFDSKTGGSYMEKLLKPLSPEHQTHPELNVSSPLRFSTNDHLEVDLEVLEPRSISRAGETAEIKRSLPPDREEIMQKHLIYETNEVSRDDKIYEVPSYLEIVKDGIPSTFDEDTGEKDIQVDEENKIEVYLTDYQSDEVSSEIDNYVDAPSTIESGMDTDSELRVKNDFTSSSINSQQMVSVRNEEHIPSLSSDSQSTGDLVISDDGNSSSKKQNSIFLSSDSPRTSTENQQCNKMPAEEISSVDIPEIAIADASSYQQTVDEFPVDQLPQPVFFDIMCIDKDAPTDSATSLAQYDSGVVTKDTLREPKADEKGPISDEEGKKINLIMDFPCSPSVSDSNSQSGNDFKNSTSGEHLVEEPNHATAPSFFIVSDSLCHTKDSSAAITTYLLHEENCDHKDLNDFENTTSTLNTSSVLSKSKINADLIPTDNSLSGELSDDVPKLTEKAIKSKILIEEKLNDMLDNEGLEVLSDASNHSSCIVEVSLGKEITETSSAKAIDAKDLYSNSSTDNQISSETLISSPIENFPDSLETGLDAHGKVFIPEDVNTINKHGDPKYCELVEVQRTGMTYDAKENDVLVLKSSSCTPENSENPEGKSDIAENNEIKQEKDVIGQEVTKMSGYEDSKSPNEEHELQVKSDFKTNHQSGTGVMASSVTAAVSDSDVRENVILPVDLDNLVNEHISCFDGSCLDELDNEKKSLSEGHESGFLEEDNIYLSESNTTSGLVDEVGVHNDKLELEVAHTYPIYLDSTADTNEVQSPLEQSVIENQVSDTTSFPVYCDTEETMLEKTELPPDQIDQESYPNSYLDFAVDTTQAQSPMEHSIENQVSDATSFPVSCDTEKTMLERTELSPDRIDQEFSDSGERSSELSSPLPINHQKILDHDEHKVDENAGPTLTLVNCPVLVSGLPEIRNHDIDISGYPNKDQSGFLFPPSNPFSETSQIDMDELPPLPPLPPVQWRMGKHPQGSSTTEDEIIKHKELFPQRSDTSVLLEETNYSLNQVVSETKSEEEKIVQSSSNLEDNSMHEAVHLPLKGENEQPELSMPAPESEVTSAAEESESANETHTAKLARPSNPLIESIAVLDKSKLRKVAERVRPQIQKVDDRDSLLEQIRTKSFNLRPPVASRPTIQGSQTNLNVAAILEKVNAFRQAFAGSDEDDEDNWSDS